MIIPKSKPAQENADKRTTRPIIIYSLRLSVDFFFLASHLISLLIFFVSHVRFVFFVNRSRLFSHFTSCQQMRACAPAALVAPLLFHYLLYLLSLQAV